MTNQLAEEKFVEADVNGDGALSPEELGGLIMGMLQDGGFVQNDDEKNDTVVREFIEHEVKLAMQFDQNFDGGIDFEEFV
eukprot:7161750-Prymnesium_polylepis.1